MKLKYVFPQTIEDTDRWGHEVFADERGNQYVLSGWYCRDYGWRVSDKEANALIKQLCVE